MHLPSHFVPLIQAHHVDGAKLYASRHDLIADLPRPLACIAEVGVAFGNFSQFLIETLCPERFVAFDLFRFHEMESAWGTPTSETLRGMTHLEFYRDRFATYAERVVCEEGDSAETLAAYPDNHFDMIYIDGDHTYEQVKADADNAKRKLKPDGLLIFNDYIIHDYTHDAPWPQGEYGIVPVVNEIVVNEDWRVFGFALNRYLFCDIGICRSSVSFPRIR